jgi:peptidoglycan/xylan/chitin deacetylase (PgdA/CDA1 family)
MAVQNITKKIYREAKYLRRDIACGLGVYDRFFKAARGNRIVIYHGICQTDHTKFNSIFLRLKTFELHLKFYKKYFNVLSLDDFYQQRFSDTKFNVCLTFDDGFANNYKYVLPLLEQYQIPAAFFITGIREAGYDILWNDFLGIISKYGPETISYKEESFYKGRYDKYISSKTGISLVETLRSAGFNEKAEMMYLLYALCKFKLNGYDEDYWLQMTKTEIADLSRSPFVTIGSHGYYHNDLARININEASKELQRSKLYLEKVIEKEVRSIAFPYGSYTPGVIDAAKKTGYTQLLATDFLRDTEDETMRERFTVNPFITTNNQMHATITRQYEQH